MSSIVQSLFGVEVSDALAWSAIDDRRLQHDRLPAVWSPRLGRVAVRDGNRWRISQRRALSFAAATAIAIAELQRAA